METPPHYFGNVVWFISPPSPKHGGHGIVLISFIPLAVSIELGYKGNCKFFEDPQTLESLFELKGWTHLT